MYWPPAGGGGVQRPLKLATHLPALGIETHVLAPDDPKWLHRDEELRPPTQAFVHRARYLGPKARLPSEELHGLSGADLTLAKARLALPPAARPRRERHLGRDGGARRAAHRQARGHRRRDHDEPSGLDEPVGAAVQAAAGIVWVADQRDSVVPNPTAASIGRRCRRRRRRRARVARLVAERADGVVTVSECDRRRGTRLRPKGPGARRSRTAPTSTTSPGSSTRPADAVPDHARGQLLRQAQPAGVPDGACRDRPRRRRRPFRGRLPRRRPRVGRELDLGDRLELIDYVPHRRALELQRDSEANCCSSPRRRAAGGASRAGRSSSTWRPSGRFWPRCRPTAPPPSCARDGLGHRRRAPTT